jgi:hypothetical protein
MTSLLISLSYFSSKIIEWYNGNSTNIPPVDTKSVSDVADATEFGDVTPEILPVCQV